MANEKVLVTGGAGFIGSHLVDKLIKNGLEVVVVDDLSSSSLDNLDDRVSFYKVDIRNKRQLSLVFKKYKGNISTVFHMAAHVDVSESMQDPVYDADVNVFGTLNVIGASKEYGVKRIVFASSYCIYGTPESLPVSEEHALEPDSYYGLSKMYGEKAVCMAEGLEAFCFRGGNVYGPRQAVAGRGEGGVIPIFLKKIFEGNSPTLRGFGKTIRDYTYVDDVAEFAFMGRSAEPGVYNVGTGIGVSVQELWDSIAEICSSKGFKIPEPEYSPLICGEIKQMVISAKKARESFGWEPKVEFKQGLLRTVDYFLENEKSIYCEGK